MSSAELHRWIRTGQVRINGKRCKPFDRVKQGDMVRVPPFALKGVRARGTELAKGTELASSPAAMFLQGESVYSGAALPPLVAESADLLVFCKPAGLATHPGTGHEDSVTTRLDRWYGGADFKPTPAHRLDKDTSGLLLVARTYVALRRLHEAFAVREKVHKEYLAWVVGAWPWKELHWLHDTVAKGETLRGEKMLVGQSEGKEAALAALCVAQRQGLSLLHIQLHTGRTHQIRVQLAARGFPVLGDGKYGGTKALKGTKHLHLHACRIVLEELLFEALPPWTGSAEVKALPPALGVFS